MRRFLVLWDIDGTLLRTNGAGMRAMAEVGRRLFGDTFTLKGIQAAGHLDPLIYQEAMALLGCADGHRHHQRFHDCYIEELRDELARSQASVAAMPGVHAVLTALHERAQQRDDVVQGLVTGNYTMAVPIKLAAVGIDAGWFRISALGDEAPTRPELVALAMRKYARAYGRPIEPRQVVVIGDTPRDVHCAKAHGCVALGVGTGGATVEELREAGADVVVADLSDPAPLWALLA